jgi:hypothetical protein
MKSENYLELLLNVYENGELTKEDLKSTLEHYAYLYNKEQKKVMKNQEYILELLKQSIVDTDEMLEKQKNLTGIHCWMVTRQQLNIAIEELRKKIKIKMGGAHP